MTAKHTEAQIRDSVQKIASHWKAIQETAEEKSFRAVEESGGPDNVGMKS